MNALKRPERFPLMNVADSGGVRASTIRYYESKFYITSTLEKYGNFIVTAEDPTGECSAPVWLPEIIGIDPIALFRGWLCLVLHQRLP